MTNTTTPAVLAGLAEALATFAAVVPGIAEGAEHLTCSEAEAIAGVLAAIGSADDSAAFIRGHAYGDDDEDDMHRALYLELHKLPAGWVRGQGA